MSGDGLRDFRFRNRKSRSPSPGRVEILAKLEEKGAAITVRRRGEAYEVLFDGRVILASNAHDTEEAFGRLAGELARGPNPRVLIGGLGFGYTLRGALASLPPAADVIVAEKVEGIIALCRGELRHVAGDPTSDRRVEVVHAAVEEVARARGRFGAILLDVDNGPDWATFRKNGWLYTDAGTRFFAQALDPGGSLAVWSGYPARRFLTVLRRAGLNAREIPLSVRGRVRARAFVGRKGRG